MASFQPFDQLRMVLRLFYCCGTTSHFSVPSLNSIEVSLQLSTILFASRGLVSPTREQNLIADEAPSSIHPGREALNLGICLSILIRSRPHGTGLMQAPGWTPFVRGPDSPHCHPLEQFSTHSYPADPFGACNVLFTWSPLSLHAHFPSAGNDGLPNHPQICV